MGEWTYILVFFCREPINKDVYAERVVVVVMTVLSCPVCVSLCNVMQFLPSKTWLCLCSMGAVFYVIPLHLF